MKVRVPAWLVFAISFSATLWLFHSTRQDTREISRGRFLNQVSLAKARILDAVADGEKALLGCAGLLAADTQVHRGEWRTYILSLDPERNFLGIQGFGFAPRVSAVDLASHVSAVRAEGFASYTVSPAGDRAEYMPIQFIEPFQGRNLRAFGYDMFSEPVRRTAMEQARDEARTILSGRVTLVQETPGQDEQFGFLLYHPLYSAAVATATVEGRRQVFRGFVYCPIRAGDFMSAIMFREAFWLGTRVYDGGETDSAHLVYDSTADPRSEQLPPQFVPSFEETEHVSLYGRTWSLKFSSMPVFDSSNDRSKPLYVLSLGFFISLLLAGMSVVLRSRDRALQAANDLNANLERLKAGLEVRVQERTSDLKKSNRLLRLLSDWNTALIHAESETHLLETMTELVIRVGGYQCCLIGYPEEDIAHTIRPVAQKGFEIDWPQGIDLTWAETQVETHPLGKAIRTRETVIVNDAIHEPVCGIWRETALRLGLGSLAAFPLISSGPVLGVLGVFSTQKEAFDPSETAILEEMALDLAFGIETQRSRVAHNQAEEELRRHREDLERLVKERSSQLHTSEERYRTVIEKTGQIVYELDVLTGRTSHVGAIEEVFQYSESEFNHLTFDQWLAGIHPDDRERTVPLLLAVTREPGSFVFEYRYRRKDNSFRHILDRGISLADDTGKVLRVIGTMADVTQQKQLEEVLQVKNRAFDASLTANSIADEKGIIREVNEAFVRIWGFSARDEVVGKPISFFIEEPGKAEEIQSSLTSAGRWDGDFIARRKAGSTFVAHALATTLVNESGAITGFQSSVLDVTEARKLTFSLEEARRAAEQANRAKRDFVANVSHEMRTPLNAIIGFSHLAQQSDPTPKQADYLRKIHLSGVNLLGIINDILDFSKIEAGKLTIEKIEFRLNDVVDTLIALVGPLAEAKGLNVIINVEPDVPQAIIGDPLRLGQILTNLLTNAVKFTEQGEIELRLTAATIDADNVELCIVVRDTGVGLSPEQLAGLFRPFHQADLSTTRRFGGTGLGLSISKGLAELMRGRVDIVSALGKGTAVTFRAPFPVAAVTSSAETIPPNLRALRVLVLESHATLRQWFCTFLGRVVSDVQAVGTAEEVVTAVEAPPGAPPTDARPFDLLIIDNQALIGGSLSLLSSLLHSSTPDRQPKVIFISSPQEKTSREQVLTLGVSENLIRPVTPSSLINALVNVFAPLAPRRVCTPAEADQNSDLKGLRLLLVEDNEMNRQIAVELLGSAGIEVTTTEHGREAVELLQRTPEPVPFDAILMDIQMPEMDGYEATRFIRRLPRYAHLPIIAMTAHAMADEREKVIAAGMNDHVSKPIHPKNLFQTLRQWTKPDRQRPLAAPEGFDGAKTLVAEQPTLRPIPPIPGVNVEEGLARLAGNAQTYLRLLREFPSAQRTNLQAIESALAENKIERARTLVHTLKGLAGNLALSEVFQAAVTLERVLKTSDWEESRRGLELLHTSFERFSQAIEAHDLSAKADRPTSHSDRPAQTMSFAQGQELLAELDRRLAANRSDARLVWGELSAGFAFPADSASDLADLGAAIDQFEFDTARRLLASLTSRLK